MGDMDVSRSTRRYEEGAPQGDGGAAPVAFKGFQAGPLQTWKITRTSASDSAQTEAATRSRRAAAAREAHREPEGGRCDRRARDQEGSRPGRQAVRERHRPVHGPGQAGGVHRQERRGPVPDVLGCGRGGESVHGKPLPEEQRKQIIASVGDAAEAAGPEGAARIAHSFAPILQPNEAKKGSKEFNSSTDLISQVTAEGHGAALGVAIAAEYNNRCDRVAGKAVMDATLNGVDHLRIDFENVDNEVDRLNDELAQRLAALGPGLTQAQQEEFAQKFKAEHAKAYDKKDKTGATLVAALRDLGEAMDNPNFTPEERRNVELQVKASLQEIPRLSETPEGLKFVTDQLAESGKGKFLLGRLGVQAAQGR